MVAFPTNITSKPEKMEIIISFASNLQKKYLVYLFFYKYDVARAHGKGDFAYDGNFDFIIYSVSLLYVWTSMVKFCIVDRSGCQVHLFPQLNIWSCSFIIRPYSGDQTKNSHLLFSKGISCIRAQNRIYGHQLLYYVSTQLMVLASSLKKKGRLSLVFEYNIISPTVS